MAPRCPADAACCSSVSPSPSLLPERSFTSAPSSRSRVSSWLGLGLGLGLYRLRLRVEKASELLEAWLHAVGCVPGCGERSCTQARRAHAHRVHGACVAATRWMGCCSLSAGEKTGG